MSTVDTICSTCRFRLDIFRLNCVYLHPDPLECSAMKTKRYDYPQHAVRMDASFFGTGNGVEEIHVCAYVTDPCLPYTRRLEELSAAVDAFLGEEELADSLPVFKRYFVSDAANMTESLLEKEKDRPYAISVVQQPPLDGSKAALWMYLQKGKTNSCYFHSLWTNRYNEEGSAGGQMTRLFADYEEALRPHAMHPARHCLRTWLYVHDIDVNYADIVKARNACFDRWGLTPRTHFIASTGIQGRQASAKVKVSMDAYAVRGLKEEQITYLHAFTHLSPTHVYGVAFERGVAVEYGDRKQLYISGTASIDCNGNVVHAGDVVRQSLRMWENVEKLLEEGGAAFRDLVQATVYLRDASDYPVVRPLLTEKMPGVPVLYVYAPVCRPEWLIEMECMAVVPVCRPEYPDF